MCRLGKAVFRGCFFISKCFVYLSMKISSKRKFKKVLAQMIKSSPCEILKDYQFVHGENFNFKSFRGIQVVKMKTPNKTIYLAPKVTI